METTSAFSEQGTVIVKGYEGIKPVQVLLGTLAAVLALSGMWYTVSGMILFLSAG